MLTAPVNPRIAEGGGLRLPRLAGDRQPATGRVRRPRRTTHRATRPLIGTLVLFAAVVLPTYAVSTGRAGWAERLVPPEVARRLSQYVGEASLQTIVLLFLGTVAFLVVVWAAVCAAAYTLGSAVDRARLGHGA